MNASGEPRVAILIQPKTHGQRFRYKCESRSAGCLIGENSTNDNKLFPTIEIQNLNNQSAIIVVSCVSKDQPYYPHPHNLVGTNCNDGVCTIRLKPPHNVAVISGVGVQCCKRQEVNESLAHRQRIRVDPFHTGADPSTRIDLSVVRLCFQVFLPDAAKKFTRVLNPVVSEQIIDKKTVHDLIIVRLSISSGIATGGDDMIILCEKVRKDDISIRFFEQSDDGELLWEAFADVGTIDVHHQYAITFKTPPYKNVNTENAVQVFIQLARPSSSEVGDPKPFMYKPVDRDPDGFEAKRKKANGLNFSSYITGNQLLPSTLDAFPEDDETKTGAATGQQTRLFKTGTRRTAANKPTAAAGSAPGVGSTFGTSLPSYSYDNIGVSSNPYFYAPLDTTGPLTAAGQDAARAPMMYTIDPGTFSLLQQQQQQQQRMPDESGMFIPELGSLLLNDNDEMMSQPTDLYQEGQFMPTFNSAELLRHLGNDDVSNLTEVAPIELGLFFNSSDGAALESLLQESSINPPNT